jgi:hypothetical protein
MQTYPNMFQTKYFSMLKLPGISHAINRLPWYYTETKISGMAMPVTKNVVTALPPSNAIRVILVFKNTCTSEISFKLFTNSMRIAKPWTVHTVHATKKAQIKRRHGQLLYPCIISVSTGTGTAEGLHPHNFSPTVHFGYQYEAYGQHISYEKRGRGEKANWCTFIHFENF